MLREEMRILINFITYSKKTHILKINIDQTDIIKLNAIILNYNNISILGVKLRKCIFNLEIISHGYVS